VSRNFRQLVALAAACALIACTAVYSAHALGERAHEHGHCDLCVHFSGSAGTPSQAKLVGKPQLTVRAVSFPQQILLPRRSPVGENRPRGPPPKPIAI
jgi:hypothetical protein